MSEMLFVTPSGLLQGIPFKTQPYLQSLYALMTPNCVHSVLQRCEVFRRVTKPDPGHVSSRENFLCPEIFLPVCV